MSLAIVNGDLLNASEDFIVHQCNCVSNNPKVLAKVLFDRFPHSNSYRKRTMDKASYSIPGTIGVCGRRSGRRKVINLYSQYYPSGPQGFDSASQRIKWFEECLDLIGTSTTGSIAMPFRIGCKAAQGSWPVYQQMLEIFSAKYNRSVTLYRLDLSVSPS